MITTSTSAVLYPLGWFQKARMGGALEILTKELGNSDKVALLQAVHDIPEGERYDVITRGPYLLDFSMNLSARIGLLKSICDIPAPNRTDAISLAFCRSWRNGKLRNQEHELKRTQKSPVATKAEIELFGEYFRDISTSTQPILQFINGCFLQKKAELNIAGVPVFFTEQNKSTLFQKQHTLSNIINKIVMRNFFTLFHELGHALTHKIWGVKSGIFLCNGSAVTAPRINNLDPLADSVSTFAGPCGSITFCNLLLLCATQLEKLKSPITKKIATILRLQTLFNMLEEAWYHGKSTAFKQGDPGALLQNGKSHYFIATTALIGLFLTGLIPTIRAGHNRVIFNAFALTILMRFLEFIPTQ